MTTAATARIALRSLRGSGLGRNPSPGRRGPSPASSSWRRAGFGAIGGCRARGFADSSTSAGAEEKCDLNIVGSPYPSIPPPPYQPLTEFVTADWVKHTGKSKKGSETPAGHLADKVAILDGTTGQTRTFREYDAHMAGIAASLMEDMGVHEDTTVCLFSPNHVDYVPITLAVAMTGARMTPVNPLYTKHELAHILEKSRTEVLIAHERLMDVALEAMREVRGTGSHGGVRHVIAIPHEDGPNAPGGALNLNDLKSHSSPVRATVPSVSKAMDTHPFLLPYSSGTTGLPKAVCLSHQNLVSNLLQMDEVEGMSFPSDHRLISPLPFFHIYGFLVSALYSAWRGQELVTLSGRFDLELFCQLVERERPQRAHLVPPIILGLAKHPMVDKYDMSSLKMIISAAAPLGADVERAVVERLDVGVKQAWGMSELSPIGTLTSDYNVKTGSIGPLVPDTYAKVIDPTTGRSLGPDETGELLIKGPQVMMGYLDAPDKTAECLSKDGWLKTGDVAHYDSEGFFYITDRLKELIKVRGYQVAPAELEALLLTHPQIKDCAVIPVEDEKSGQLPRAYVVLKEDDESKKQTEADIAEWVKERVAPYKKLAGGVRFTEEIPKSASGKILRRVLVEKDRHGEQQDEC